MTIYASQCTVGVHRRVMTALIPEVSIIIPIHNGKQWIDSCMQSILDQTALRTIPVEVSIFNDGSTDGSAEALQQWYQNFKVQSPINVIISHQDGSPKGVGYAKNHAVAQSHGRFLCFQDVDDLMLPNRILLQYTSALDRPNAIIGTRFERDPPGSTARFTRWANTLSPEQLGLQVYTSHGPTVIMPTWFCSRAVYDRVGGFSEEGRGTPEDLIFFYKHLDLGGTVFRVDETLLIYRYHLEAVTFSIHEDTIWNLRIARLQTKVLPQWKQFSIWNAGKQGRKFYRSLLPEFRERVVALCDVDEKKIGHEYKQHFPGDPQASRASRPLPIISYKDASPPFIICVKLDFTEGVLERTIQLLGLKEGSDFIFFS